MKKALLLSAIAALFLFSCKKDNTAPPTGKAKMYKVTFDAASTFSQTINTLPTGKQRINNLATDAINLGSYTSVFALKIYDSNNILVRQDYQYASKVTNYGIIVDSLAAGTYTVVAAAGQTGLYMAIGPDSRDAIIYAPNNFTPWSDTFFSKFQITVNGGPLNQAVTLNRIVSKLEVDFTGTIPLNASRVDVNLNKENFQYLTSTGALGLPDTVTYHFTVPDSVKGKTAYTISHIVLNTATPFNVILTAYDSSNTVIATHTIPNVACHINERTILTGNFAATTSSNQAFNITVDPSWGTQTIVHY